MISKKEFEKKYANEEVCVVIKNISDLREFLKLMYKYDYRIPYTISSSYEVIVEEFINTFYAYEKSHNILAFRRKLDNLFWHGKKEWYICHGYTFIDFNTNNLAKEYR